MANSPKIKKRLDLLVQDLLPGASRTQAINLILQRAILVNGQVVDKPGKQIDLTAQITCLAAEAKYVSRAGFKLEKALQEFAVAVTGLVVLDAGLSTGGFADCLLQAGALKIYGVDVGTHQAHSKIANDARVQVLEQTNLRYLEKLPELVDLVTLDLSFISLLKVIDNVLKLLKPSGQLITLIKPQFEVGPQVVDAHGVVKNIKLREQAVAQVVAGIEQAGFSLQGLIESPLVGGDGNIEYLAHFTISNSKS